MRPPVRRVPLYLKPNIRANTESSFGRSWSPISIAQSIKRNQRSHRPRFRRARAARGAGRKLVR
eukprot:4625527-Prymnesium_polylepis.1